MNKSTLDKITALHKRAEDHKSNLGISELNIPMNDILEICGVFANIKLEKPAAYAKVDLIGIREVTLSTERVIEWENYLSAYPGEFEIKELFIV